MRAHHCPDFDQGLVKPGDSAMEFCLCSPVSKEQTELAAKPCVRPCVDCADGLHHWLPDCDEDNGQPLMKCKHCEAAREYTDEDAEY